MISVIWEFREKYIVLLNLKLKRLDFENVANDEQV